MLNYILSVVVVVSCFIPTFACMAADVAPSSLAAFFAGLWLVVGLVFGLLTLDRLSGRALRRVAAAALAASMVFGGACVVFMAPVSSTQAPAHGIVVVERDGVDSQDGFSGRFVAVAYDASGVVVAREVEEVDRAERLSGDVAGFVSCFQERGFSVVRR